MKATNLGRKGSANRLYVSGSQLPAICDDDIFEVACKQSWYLSPEGYVQSNGKVRRLAWLALDMKDEKRGRICICYVNDNKLDCRRENLVVLPQGLSVGSGKLRKTNTSGYVGVIWDKRRKRWMAALQVNRKSIRVGAFHDAMAAAKARDLLALKILGPYARVNFPHADALRPSILENPAETGVV